MCPHRQCVRLCVLKPVSLILPLHYPVLWSTCSQVKIMVPLAGWGWGGGGVKGISAATYGQESD